VAKKRKKQAKRASSSRALSPEDLLRAGREALAARRYREAMDHFKAVAKTDTDGSVWEAGLAEAYRGRALELQAKGMEREALMIWENLDRLLPGRAPDPAHLILCLRMGRSAIVAQGYKALVQGGESTAARALLQAHLAASCLGEGRAPDFLEADDPVLRDAEPARAALEAYCRGEEATASEALRRIPFRSPYRDYAAAMKALLMLGTDSSAAERLLARIDADSPFHAFAEAVRLAWLPEPAFLDALRQAGPQSRTLAFALRGWPEERVRLWQELEKIDASANPLQLVGLLDRLREPLGEPWARQKMRALVLAKMPRQPPPAAMRAFSHTDWNLISAQHVEDDYDLWTVVDRWRTVFARMRADYPGSAEPGNDAALRIALLQRRLATELKLLKTPAGSEVEQELEQSLSLDPEYLPGYLLLIRHFRESMLPKEARRILAEAQRRWPEDVELLNEALDLALDNGAFKKATGLARRILAKDPINRRARRSLYQAHLAHARKQWRGGRADLALREMEQAESWSDDAGGRARVELLRGIVLLETGSGDSDALKAACERAAPGAAGWLMLALEAARVGVAPRALLKRARFGKVPALKRDDVLAFARLLREEAETGGDVLAEALAPFQSALEKAARLKLQREDYETLCESLRLAGHALLRATFAKAALKRWRGDPLFELHAFQAKRSDPRHVEVTLSDIHRLETAMDRAQAEGDTRTAMRLEQEFRKLYPPPAFDPFAPDEDFDDDDFPDGDFDLGPPPSEEELRALLDLLEGTPEGRRLRDLERELGSEEVLKALAEAAGDIADMPAPPRPPPPAKPRKRTRRGKSRPKRADDADPDSDDNSPDQLKLF